MNREHHYWWESGRSEYWEFRPSVGWVMLTERYPDWPLNSYRYVQWYENSGAEAKKGFPPRVWI